ncbi:MAG TPA: phosphatidylglycerol lysyltransferase domain-containing protein [Kineosporiaceae bacterium]|nr:phosphatidylglycerol lysyltransferase domain-containing protein [Kineosporiaceae bacterium]
MATTSGVRAADEAPVRERPPWRPRVPGLVAWVVRLAAVFAVLDILNPAERRHHVYPRALGGVINGSVFAAAVFAAGAMLVLAGGLKRRKRRAWLFAVGAVLLGMVAHLPAHRWSVVAVNLAVLVLLLIAQRDFTARSERTGRVAAVRVFLVMGTVSLIAGLFLTSRTAPHSALGDRLWQVVVGLLGFTPDLDFPTDVTSNVTEIALNTLGALTALLTLLTLLAPARKPATLSPDAEQGLRGLLQRFGGRDSLGYFALRGDKTAIFSPSGKAAVVYRVVGGVTLAAGDPLGDREAWPGAIHAWLDEADTYAWIPGVIGASEEGAIAYKRLGLDSLELGDEAVLYLDEFTLEGRSMRGVRQAVHRVKRAGYTLDVRRQRDIPPDELGEARATAEALRGEDVERGFSMALGRLGDPADPDLVVARARDVAGRLVAVLTFVPWGDDGLSLDLMRRARDSENGTVEFVVAGVAQEAGRLGVTRISLNFAVFRSVFERGARVGAGPVLRLWHRVLLVASRWWQIESLYRANAKYQPEWVPRFLCFRRASELPRVGMAALEAEAFVQFPRLRWLAR